MSKRQRPWKKSAGRPRKRRRVARYRRYAPSTEKKFHDFNIDDAIIASAGWTVQAVMLTIPEGNGEQARVGRKITLTNINWRWNLRLPTSTTAASGSDVVRMVVVLDKQCNGALAPSTELFADDVFNTFNDLANTRRFRVLYDRMFTLNASGAGTSAGGVDLTGDTRVAGTWYKQVNIPIEYDSSVITGIIGTVRSNNLVMYTISLNNVCALDSRFRVRYIDA